MRSFFVDDELGSSLPNTEKMTTYALEDASWTRKCEEALGTVQNSPTTEKVSIVVPVYNMEKYLDQCVQSLIRQSYRNIEIILINDGSSDNSAEICKKYAEYDPRVIYIDHRNQGTAATRNAGVEKGTGTWIMFVDADDWLPENSVAALTACANEYDIVIGDYYFVSNGKTIWQHFFRPDITDEKKTSPLWLIGNALGCPSYGLSGGCNIGVPWARLFRRAFLVENGISSPVGLKRMQDTVLNIRAFLHSPRIDYCPQPVYYYRAWGQSASRAYDSHFADTAVNLLACIREPVGDNPNQKIRELYGYKELSLLIETISLYYCHKDCPLRLREKLQGLKTLCESPINAALLKRYDKSLFGVKTRVSLWMLAHRLYLGAYCLKRYVGAFYR